MKLPSFMSTNTFKSRSDCAWKGTYEVEADLSTTGASAVQVALIEFDQNLHDTYCVECQKESEPQLRGVIDFDNRKREWVLACPEHGPLKIAFGDAERNLELARHGHDELVRFWAKHYKDFHGGSGKVRSDDLIVTKEAAQARR